MLERCLKRGETSGRSDDKPEILKNRVSEFFKYSDPVCKLYKKFNKVHIIDATVGISEVYEHTKNAILPQTFFLIGPKASGKS
jgi:UMP-CMP kinase